MNGLSFLLFLFLFLFQGCSAAYLDGQDFSLNHKPIPKEANLIKESNIHLSLVDIESLSPQVLDSMPRSSAAKIPSDLRHISFSDVIDNSLPEYLIGPGDVLQIYFPTDPNVERTTIRGLKVDSLGEIEFPYLGKYKISGFTSREAQELLNSALTNLYVNPQVQILIKEYKSNKVFVSGIFGGSALDGASKVSTKMLILDDVPLTVIQALDKVGVSFSESIPNPFLILKRNENNHIVDLGFISNNADPNIYVKNNDFLYIPGEEPQKVYITGATTSDFTMSFPTSLTLSEALLNSNINKNIANLQEIYVLRVNQTLNNQIYGTAYRVSVKSPTGLILADKFHLLDKDIIFVSTDKLKRWNQTVTRLLSSLDVINVWRGYKPINSDILRRD